MTGACPPPIKIMGVLNITPDSFSDGGQYDSCASATAQADAMIAAGADIIDIGGESTRPFAEPVSTDEELARVIPVIEAIRRKHSSPVSIDTTKAQVAREAISVGADIINDISALRSDPAMIEVVRETAVPLVIMHMQGTPKTMQAAPSYTDVVGEIMGFFRERVSWLKKNGIDAQRIILDPGIGFGKKLEHNLAILKRLQTFSELGLPVLLGHSRKRFLGDITGVADAQKRDLSTAIVSALALSSNISILRVHDVAATRQAIQVVHAIAAAA